MCKEAREKPTPWRMRTYDLPEADDSLEAVKAGRSPREHLRTETRRPEAGLTEISLVNDGEADLSSRLVIESVFANLKGQMRLERHLAKTPAGLAVRIAQRILALTIGVLLNTLAGRPARALAAYDGR